jgi:hypothetical protein
MGLTARPWVVGILQDVSAGGGCERGGGELTGAGGPDAGDGRLDWCAGGSAELGFGLCLAGDKARENAWGEVVGDGGEQNGAGVWEDECEDVAFADEPADALFESCAVERGVTMRPVTGAVMVRPATWRSRSARAWRAMRRLASAARRLAGRSAAAASRRASARRTRAAAASRSPTRAGLSNVKTVSPAWAVSPGVTWTAARYPLASARSARRSFQSTTAGTRAEAGSGRKRTAATSGPTTASVAPMARDRRPTSFGLVARNHAAPMIGEHEPDEGEDAGEDDAEREVLAEDDYEDGGDDGEAIGESEGVVCEQEAALGCVSDWRGLVADHSEQLGEYEVLPEVFGAAGEVW